jgi:5-methylcytosine-specific restriction endonuclease McrA
VELRTLLLNSWSLPHAILNWRESICLVYEKKVHVLEEYEETVSSPSTTYYVPAVLQLKRAVAPMKKGVKFSRINVFTRDKFRCQYCGDPFPMGELNYDHVVPRKHGGKTTWTNIVAACLPCNGRKGARTPEQAGMKLLRHPAKPHALPLHSVFLGGADVPEVWLPYVDLNKIQKNGSGYYMMGYDSPRT